MAEIFECRSLLNLFSLARRNSDAAHLFIDLLPSRIRIIQQQMDEGFVNFLIQLAFELLDQQSLVTTFFFEGLAAIGQNL